jgi:hypothetical protein
MPLKLAADECVDGRIVLGVRARGIDVATAAEQNLLGASDDEHLSRSVASERVLVTSDHDFLTLVHARLGDGLHFPGLLFILPRTPVGDAVRAIVDIALTLEEQRLANNIYWIGPR